MDPVTAFGVVAGGVQVVQAIVCTIEGLSSLRGKYKNADLTIRSLIGELSTIKAAINQLSDWSKYNSQKSASNREYDEGLDVALEGCHAIMEVLAEEVAGLCENTNMGSTGVLGFKARMRVVWNDALMQNLEDRLHAQVRALNLLLQACQCQTSTEQIELLRKVESRQIIRKVADDTVSLRSRTNSVLGSQADSSSVKTRLSSIDELEYNFEQTLAHSALYQRVQSRQPEQRRPTTFAEFQPKRSQVAPPSDEGYSSLDMEPTFGARFALTEVADIPSLGLRPNGPSPITGARSNTIAFAQKSQPLVTTNVRRWQSTDTYTSTPSSPNGSRRGKFISALKRLNTTSIADLKSSSSRRTPSRSLTGSSRRGRRGSERDLTTSIDLSTPEGANAPPLVKAAQLGSCLDIEALIENGHNIEARHLNTRRNALLVASHCGRTEIVNLLVHGNANLNAVDATGSTALHLAASRGHQSTVELLLMEKMELERKTNLGRTPLWVAVMNGQLDTADLLLSHGAKVNARADNQMTALHLAAKQDDVEMAELLIAKGADLDARDASMMAPLHYASEAGNLDLIDLLVGSRADINIPGGSRKTPLICAAAAGQHLAVQLLLKKRGAFKCLDEGGMTALHWAAFNGHVEIVEILKQKVGWLSMANSQGRTALHLATMNSQFAVVEMLLRDKPNLNIRCQSGLSPLHYACAGDNLEVVELLLTCGADIEAAAGEMERRPLHIAAARGSTRVLNLLCEKGVLIEARDGARDRALCIACRLGHVAVVQKLLDSGSALTLRFGAQSHEDSPLCLAVMGGHLSVVSLLLDRGASVFSKDENGWPPLRYAVYYGHPGVLKLLLTRHAPPFDKDCPTGPGLAPENIGFASDAGITEERKRQVVELMRAAMTGQRQPSIGYDVAAMNRVSNLVDAERLPRSIPSSYDQRSSLFTGVPLPPTQDEPQELPSTLVDGLPTSRSNTPDHLRGNANDMEETKEPDPMFPRTVNQLLFIPEDQSMESVEQASDLLVAPAPLRPQQPSPSNYTISAERPYTNGWFSPDDVQEISLDLRHREHSQSQATFQPRALLQTESLSPGLTDPYYLEHSSARHNASLSNTRISSSAPSVSSPYYSSYQSPDAGPGLTEASLATLASSTSPAGHSPESDGDSPRTIIHLCELEA